ncbi:hypothetical protein LHP98_17150 [Rhodobacter sp. Har01]|uniref:hypothetical protein n=1 Tax=Rhodobacter sp. Har01 TaxID=2883999 RepID=UPI001D07236F|nr:hypothetical protein [Rhodobacter sp. Har01]MCB6179851.1 hypothetical protein [Rhodobacter sp. Har01]
MTWNGWRISGFADDSQDFAVELVAALPLRCHQRCPADPGAALGREGGGDFGRCLFEGEAVDPGQDEGAEIGVGFQLGQRSAAVLGAPDGGVQGGFKRGF